MGGFCLLVELHREGSAPAACLFYWKIKWIIRNTKGYKSLLNNNTLFIKSQKKENIFLYIIFFYKLILKFKKIPFFLVLKRKKSKILLSNIGLQ